MPRHIRFFDRCSEYAAVFAYTATFAALTGLVETPLRQLLSMAGLALILSIVSWVIGSRLRRAEKALTSGNAIS